MTQPWSEARTNRRAEPAVPPLVSGPLLVATTGEAEADASVTAAALFARRTNATVQAITVVPPTAVGYVLGVMPLPADLDADKYEEQLLAARTQIKRLAGTAWPVTAEFGEPPKAIANLARAINARLIVMGHGRRLTADRIVGGEHVLQALQDSDTPVFAAAPGVQALPRRILIATDFTDLSAYAAEFALAFIAPDAHIYLVNVMPDADTRGGDWDHERADNYRRGLAEAFTSAQTPLHREQLVIEPVTLVGDPASEIIRYASQQDADLVVFGTQGHGFLRQFMLGSVATNLIRSLHCSILCIPGSAAARLAMRDKNVPGQALRSYATTEWATAMEEFSKRNLGRLCTIEINHKEMGAHIQGTAVPFIGAVYDHNGNQAELMFGEQQLPGRHFANAIPNVRAIEVVRDHRGIDQSLRVSNGIGFTKLAMTMPSPDADDLKHD